MAQNDYYEILGVTRGADADAIKKAYRALALKYHPDRNAGDKKAEETFKRINQAYDTLSDPKKKALYDEFGEMGLREGFNPDQFRQYQSAFGGAGGPGGAVNFEDLFGRNGGGGGADYSSIFDQFFGNGFPGAAHVSVDPGRSRRRASVPRKGPDLEGEITIDFATAVRGGEVSLNINGDPLKVRIPPGVRDGRRVRLAGKGVPSPGGEAGDLLLTVHVEEHPSFWYEGDDLHVRVPVTLVEAWRGAKVKVPTPAGEVTVRIPPHTSSGAKLRLRGKGTPSSKNQEATDLIVHVELVLPPAGPAVEEAMKALESIPQEDPRASLKL